MEKKKEPLQKLAFAWLFFIILILIFITIYFLKTPRCDSTNFLCIKSDIEGNHLRLQLFNNLYDVDLINLTASCNLNKFTFNEKFDYVTFEVDKTITIDIYCTEYIKTDMNVTLSYSDKTNLTHTDVIAVKR